MRPTTGDGSEHESVPVGSSLPSAAHLAFQTLDAHSPDALFATNAQGEITYISQASNRLFGLAPWQLIGKSLSALLAGLGGSAAPSSLEAALETHRPVQDLVIALPRAGGALLVELNSAPFLVNGTPAGATGQLRDITHRHTTDPARLSEAARLTLALEASNAGIWEWDLETNENFWSEELWRVYGLEPHSCRPSYEAWRQLVLPEDRDLAERTVQAAAHNGAELIVEFRIRRPDGALRWILSQGRLLRLAPDKPGRFIGIAVDVTQRRQAEEDLRSNRAHLDAALASMTDAVFISDAEGRFVEFNEAFATFHRFRNKQECARTFAEYPAFLEVFMADGAPAPLEMWAVPRALRGEIVTNAEYSLRRKDTGETWIGSYSFAPLRDARGGIVGSVVAARDITQMRHDEDARRQSESRLSFALETTGTGAWDLDLRDHSAQRSLLHDRIFGHQALLAEWSFEIFLSYVLPEDRAEVTRKFQTAVQTGTDWDFECRIRRVDGEVRWIWAAGRHRRDGSGRPSHMAGVVQDITERKNADQALLESEDHRRAILQTAMDGFCVADSDGRILEVNESYCRMSGYTAAELLSMRVCDLEANESEEQQRAHFQRVAQQREDRFESRHRRKDGSLFDLEISMQYLPAGGGQLAAFLRDITDRKRAEQERDKLQSQFLQAQKMESVGRLAGGIAHDFNNLLTVINGYSQMLLDSLTPVDPLRGSLSEIHKAGERAASLTQQLLAFSRKQILSPRLLDVNRVVRDMLPMLKRLVGEDIDVFIALNAENGSIHADAHQIEQVIMNLVVNARDAMPAVGKLVIETTGIALDERYVKAHHNVRLGRYVQLTISDTGIGMDAETRSRIFEPFFTTKEPGKGTGLGLSTVQGIVAQSGGYVDVYSEPGIGTTFKIYLPASTGAVVDTNSPAAVPALGGKETVLVVEDLGEVRKYAVEVLKAYGYRVLQAAGAVEALLICEHERIDLVLTDVVMPNMSGRDLVERLKAREPSMRVLFMSGYTDNVIAHRGLLEPGTSFIQKPFSPQSLAHQVRTALGSAAASARILVAEQEIGVRRFLCDALEGHGYTVTEAVDYAQVLHSLRSGPVDLLLTDLSVPGQEGLENLQALRSEAPNTGIIAISSGFASEGPAPGRLQGADAILHKPLRVDKLLEKVNQVLRLRR
ncbi:PAS domain S-box protein [Paludibaculum fermentans]|uniref:hybrid sensor histidine kinase/response regulator n=1 Tax=Paludibaculum fermentans TaxID=1473598 RepID=UPI003EB9093F